MFTAENRVGRLIEVRLDSAGTLPDHQTLNTLVFALLAKQTGSAVFCTDTRRVESLTDELAARMAKSYRVANAKVHRTAMLVRKGTLFHAQLETIVREAGSRARRVFTDPEEARAWLGEVLDTAEKVRLAAFIDEGGLNG